jgi:hypothetical protein
MSTTRRKPLVMPQRGRIKGGMCNGYTYLFQRFEVIDGALRVRAKISAPNWPFPCDAVLNAAHFGQFRAVPGERAKRLQAEPLIEQAYGWAQLPVPAWGDRHRTIRARVLRSGTTRQARTAA